MKTPIADPISYNGWIIKLYLENYGFSFQMLPPINLPIDPIEDGRIYPSVSKAWKAAKKLVQVDMVLLTLELWLAEMYQSGKISLDEHELLCNSLVDAFDIEESKS